MRVENYAKTLDTAKLLVLLLECGKSPIDLDILKAQGKEEVIKEALQCCYQRLDSMCQDAADSKIDSILKKD